MSLKTVLADTRTIYRQLLVLETLYPALHDLSVLWYFFPEGRPSELGHDARYILYIYRALDDERERLHQWLMDNNLGMWGVAVESETLYEWNLEWRSMDHHTRAQFPIIPQFDSSDIHFAVA